MTPMPAMEKEILSNPDPPTFSFARGLIVYLVLCGYFYFFSAYGLNIWDEGGYAYGTLRTLNGQKALVDFNPSGYLPGRYLYAALFFKLFGIHIDSLRLGIILLTPGMILMVYLAARKIMPPGFAFLAALCMLSAPSMYYNRFYPFFCVLNLYCLLQVIDKRKPPQFLLLGGTILLSGFFKFEVALFSALISLAAIGILAGKPSLREGTPRISEGESSASQSYPPAFWGGALVLFTAFTGLFIFFLKNEFFGKVFKLVVESHNVWGNPFPDLLPFFSLLAELGPHEMFERILFYLPVWVYIIVAVLLMLRLLRKNNGEGIANLLLFVVLLFGICSFGLVIWRAGFDNLLRTLAPLYILFCYLLYLLRKSALRTFPFALRGNQAADFLKITILNVLSVFLPFMFCYEMNYNHGFYAGSIGAMKNETTLVEMDRMKIYTNPQEAGWIRQVVNRIETYSRKGDPILALPLNPIFYFLTDRVNPTRYDWILPGMLTQEDEKQIIEKLMAEKPKLVIFVDIPIDGKDERRLSRYAPGIYDFISKNYVFEELIGFFQIHLPREYYQQ